MAVRSDTREGSDGARARSTISARQARLRARLPRYLLFAFLVVMCLAGIHSILEPPGPAAQPAAPSASVDYAAQSFAIDFARAYLGDSGGPREREAALAPFVGSALETDAGFEPARGGSRQVLWADVAQVQRPLAGGLIITVAAQLSGAREPVYLSVPVRRQSGGALALAGYPAFVGPPLSAAPDLEEGGREAVTSGEVARLVRRALTNYLAGDAEDLSADLARAATVTLPTNRLRLREVTELVWVDGNGGGAVLAMVSAGDGRGGTYLLRYEVGLRRVRSSDPGIAPGWRVTYVQTISQEP